MKHDFSKIQRLVGNVTTEQLRYVDCFVGEHVGLFMPVGGPCYYGILPNHTHPAYMFTLPFNDQTFVDIGGKTIQAQHGMIFALSPETSRSQRLHWLAGLTALHIYRPAFIRGLI